MEFERYIRKPFTISAVEVTKDNIGELAELIGEGRTRQKDNGDPYFVTNGSLIRNKAINRVELGYWITKLNDEFRIYKPGVFKRIFWDVTPERERLFSLLQEQDRTNGTYTKTGPEEVENAIEAEV